MAGPETPKFWDKRNAERLILILLMFRYQLKIVLELINQETRIPNCQKVLIKKK